MSRFRNTATEVVVTVDDSKDSRFGREWERVEEAKPKRAAAKKSEPADEN